MANTDKVYAVPATEVAANALIVTTGSAAWAYGGWYPVLRNIKAAINIYSLAFQLTAIPTADAVQEYIIEIGTGNSQTPTTKIQLPYSQKSDTAVGIYLTDPIIYLPEAVAIPAGSHLYIRAACGTANVTINNIKIMYTSTAPIEVVQNFPNNYKRIIGGGTPMGVM